MDSAISAFEAEEFLERLACDVASLSVLSATSPMLVVDLKDWEHSSAPAARAIAGGLPACPVIGVHCATQAWPDFVDVVVESDAELAQIQSIVERCPHAATVFVQLLRYTTGLPVAQGLFAESLAYSTLQHGVEFAAWLRQQEKTNRQRQPMAAGLSEPAVQVARETDRLLLTLNRPRQKNAFSAEMRDLLCEALELALLDKSIAEIHLAAAGSAFSAGGDLREFGQARDAAVAHLSRTTRSAGALLHRLRERVRVSVHGACIGAGIELPAFAGWVRAHPDSFFALPEVSLGLVPGAGGCISLPRRIGRHRTAFMGLTGARIGAQKALAWGLIDELAVKRARE